MNAEHLDNLRERIKRRVDLLRSSQPHLMRCALVRFLQFVIDEPLLNSILMDLRKGYEAIRSKVNLYILEPELFDKHRSNYQQFKVSTDRESIVFAAFILDEVYQYKDHVDCTNISNLLQNYTLHSSSRDQFDILCNTILQPLFDYLIECLDGQALLVGWLLRYKKRCEWFTRQDLFKLALPAAAPSGKKIQEIEKWLKQDLYRYLHDQGKEFVIEPQGARGEIDLIADQKGNPTLIEGKVFDSQNRNKKYIAKGFGQLASYAKQHNATVAYLATYNVCEKFLVIEGEGDTLGIPYFRHDNITYYVMVIDIFMNPNSPSKQGQLVEERITRADLIQ